MSIFTTLVRLSLLADVAMLGTAQISWAQQNGAPPKPPKMPEGPYASWSEADRKSGTQMTLFKCMTLNAMIHGSPYKSPADNEATQAYTMSCIALSMPPDWPQRVATLAEAEKHAAAARKIDPKFPEVALVFKPLPPSAH